MCDVCIRFYPKKIQFRIKPDRKIKKTGLPRVGLRQSSNKNQLKENAYENVTLLVIIILN